MTEEGLKSTIKKSPLEEILRPQYEFRSADNLYYILVIYVIGLDGVGRAIWSKYSYDDLIVILEGQTMLSKDFDKKIQEEGYIESGFETVVVQ